MMNEKELGFLFDLSHTQLLCRVGVQWVLAEVQTEP